MLMLKLTFLAIWLIGNYLNFKVWKGFFKKLWKCFFFFKNTRRQDYLMNFKKSLHKILGFYVSEIEKKILLTFWDLITE